MGYSNIAAGQGRYLGTLRTTAAAGTPARGGVTEDSFGAGSQNGGKRFLWNRYNRTLRHLGVKDSTDSWTYGTATWRQANAAIGNKVEIVIGLTLDIVTAEVHAMMIGGNNTQTVNVGVGIDSTTVNSALLGGANDQANDINMTRGCYRGYLGVGWRTLNWLEIASAAGSATFAGDNGLTFAQSGMLVEAWG